MLKNRIMKIKILILAVINLTFSLFPGQFFSVSYGQTTPSSIVVDPAGIGAERVARLFTPVYQSKFATTDDTIRWVQIDLGQPPRIEAVKLYPRILPWNYSQSEGFPSHFKIEVSNEPDFRNSVILENRDRIGYPDPVDMVCTFESKEVTGREKTAIWQYPYDRPHCYLITAIEPYLDLYIVTGAKKYLDAAMGGWDLYHDNWIHVGGSIAICEGTELYPPKSYFLHRSTGELCGSVFWVKLNQRFHLLSPEDEKYVTEIEKSIYNVAIANQIGTKGIRYFNVLVDHKDTDHFPYSHCMNTCCEGQGTRLFGSLPEYIYSFADDGIYVNLFVDSKIKFAFPADSMELNMTTKFPYDPQVKLAVATIRPLQAKIRIRISSWASKDMPVLINGKKAVTGKPGTYVTLLREWKNGDIISFDVPMSFRTTLYRGSEEKYNDGQHYALEYGPFLMAAVKSSNSQNEIRINTKPEQLIKSIKSIPGNPLCFTIKNNEDIEYRPYFEIQDEPFTCYPAISDK